MKHLPIVAIMLPLVVFFLTIPIPGCSINRQTGISITYDPKTGIVATNSLSMVTWTTGNAKQAVESQKGSVGKTISIGVTGVGQETDMATTIKAIGDVAEQVFSAGAKAGAATVAKSIAP